MLSRYGRYEVLYKLGQGAMAQVFLARDPLLMRFVAVKILHADLAARKDVLQRFFTEARTVAAVRNPHVVEVFDFGQEGKDLFLVMEFVDGLSLHALLRRIGLHNPEAENPPVPSGRPIPSPRPLGEALTAALMCQAAEGLSVAAQHGVVHRDIKPENLMINQQGYLKISDFGIAHVQDESITKTGAVLGSPLFMSPEQARGLKPITSQADMFSLGAVFYACLAGFPPFQGRTITEIFRKISSEPHVPIGQIRPGLDPALCALIDTLLQKDPAQRGGGPRWLHRQLKSHLALSAIDAPESIAAYLQELSAQGVQTTLRMESDARAETLAATTLPAFQPSATL
ncbi:MAG: serine/threonine-protein kinase, partial [Fibrobacteria bacterium]